MPTDNQQDNSDNISNNGEPATPSNRRNQTSRNSATGTHSRKKQNTIVEIVSIPNIDETEVKEANRIAARANEIALKSIRVNVFLALVTVILAGAAIIQYRASLSAAQTAYATFVADTIYNYQNIRHQKTTDSLSKISDSIKNKHDSSVFQLQIASLQETQREFSKANEAYLQISNFDMGKFKADVPIISYDISNISKQPVKTISGYRASFVDPDDKEVIKKIKIYESKKEPFINETLYITEQPHAQSYYMPNGVDKKFADAVERLKFKIYLYGKIKYQNLVTEKYGMYAFCVEIETNGNYRMIYQKNTNIKFTGQNKNSH